MNDWVSSWGTDSETPPPEPDVLRGHPAVGRRVEGMPGIRELLIPRTPFSFIYRVVADRIEVLRVWDRRGDRSRLRSTGSPGR